MASLSLTMSARAVSFGGTTDENSWLVLLTFGLAKYQDDPPRTVSATNRIAEVFHHDLLFIAAPFLCAFSFLVEVIPASKYIRFMLTIENTYAILRAGYLL